MRPNNPFKKKNIYLQIISSQIIYATKHKFDIK